MLYYISVYLESGIYTFKNQRSRIICNGVKLNFDLNKLDDNQPEIQDIYKSLLKSGKNKLYSRIKACLYNAPYVECSFLPAIEIMDQIVLFLYRVDNISPEPEFQNIELKKNIKIFLNDQEVYSGKEHYSIQNTNLIDFDYTKLLIQLILDCE